MTLTIDENKFKQRLMPNVDLSKEILPMAFALIAFTKRGLDKVSILTIKSYKVADQSRFKLACLLMR